MQRTLEPINTRLDRFNSRDGLVRGRSKPIEASWYIFKIIFILSSFPWPSYIKVLVLRFYGAKIGKGLVIKPRVNIHFPWKLELGDHVWIGEESFILNLEKISIGSNSCISQRVFLCTGNHNFRDQNFGYLNSPIIIGSGVWIGAGSIICPGVSIGDEAVAFAGSVVTSDIAENNMVAGNPARTRGERWTNRKRSE
jgi:putative colanic acid biosynthesis acetyltransferase WcaF